MQVTDFLYTLIKAINLGNLSEPLAQCSVISPPSSPAWYKFCVHQELCPYYYFQELQETLFSLIEIDHMEKNHKLVPWVFPRA